MIGAAKMMMLPFVLLVAAPAGAASLPPQPTEEERVTAALESTLRLHGGEVHRCFEKALADSMDVAGKVELQVDIGEGGRVTRAVTARDEVRSPVLLACLQDAAGTWTMAGLEPGSSVIVPLAFAGQMAQFTIKAADAPDRGPPAPKTKRKGLTPSVPPFSVKVLVDEATMRARQASLSLLTIAPANRIAKHRHPGSEILYVLKGHARILGPTGSAPEKIDEGMAVFIPGGMPHVIENMGRQNPVILLEVFAPAGPERVFRDPADEKGRAAFEVIRDESKATAPADVKIAVVDAGAVDPLPIAGGKGKVRILLDAPGAGSKDASLGILELEPGTELPRHTHPGAAEILYVLSGPPGELTVGSEKIPFGPDQAIHLPEDQPHAVKTGPGEKTVLVQVFAPAGSEQRYRGPTGTAAPKRPVRPGPPAPIKGR